MPVPRFAAPFALCALLLGPGAALAADASQDAVLTALSGFEDAPTAQGLAALGDNVDVQLRAIVASDASKTTRARALHALGWFPDDTNRQLLLDALGGDDKLMARKAAYALGNGWGDAAVADLSVALAADDVQLRMAAARSLGNVNTPAARAALEARVAVESSGAAKDVMTKALATPAAP